MLCLVADADADKHAFSELPDFSEVMVPTTREKYPKLAQFPIFHSSFVAQK